MHSGEYSSNTGFDGPYPLWGTPHLQFLMDKVQLIQCWDNMFKKKPNNNCNPLKHGLNSLFSNHYTYAISSAAHASKKA